MLCRGACWSRLESGEMARIARTIFACRGSQRRPEAPQSHQQNLDSPLQYNSMPANLNSTRVLQKRIVVFQSGRDRKMLIEDLVSAESATVFFLRTLLVTFMGLIWRRAKVSFHSLSPRRISRSSRL